MSRIINKAEGFEVAYEAFQNINFNAFDFFSIKQSMVEYIKTYFPETFNDFIESSEFIAILELFSYLGEIMAYRSDMNAHENLIDFAERKQSVLRLAKFLSYKSSRNVPARGLVRFDSVSTSEVIFDAKGVNLSNKTIKWNDPSNPDWKDQFFVVINRLLEQDFGTVSENERRQVNDILFELYPLKNQPILKNAIPYSTSITDTNFQMELVSSVLTEFGPEEARPQNNGSFNILYGSDGLGDGSLTTGFFMYTKQGTLNKITKTFDGILPNQNLTIDATNINETDLWINNIDENTGDTIDDGSSVEGRTGEWVPVDLSNAQNIIFNTNPNRSKYEVETLENDSVRIIYGDGEFSDIPSGKFDIWYRESANEELFIPRNGVVNKSASFSYIDDNSRTQTFNFTFSLISSLQNNSPSEDIEQIRRNAPAVYYTQDRMVNGRDYNSFPLQDPSILKLRTVNRSFAGQSNFEQINDSSSTYQDIKLFGDDLSIFYKDSIALTTALGNSSSSVLLTNYIEPLLSTVDFFIKHIIDYPTISYRKEFDSAEEIAIEAVFNSAVSPWPVALRYDSSNSFVWTPTANANKSADTWNIFIELSADSTTYTITYTGKHMVGGSNTTRFYNQEGATQPTLTFDSLNSNIDELVILKANPSNDPTKLLTDNINLRIIDIERNDSGLPNAGLPNLNRVTVVTKDINSDSIPDDILLANVINKKLTFPITIDNQTITLPDYYIVTASDISAVGNNNPLAFTEVGSSVSNQIIIVDGITTGNTEVIVTVKEYVYFKRDTVEEDFIIVENTLENLSLLVNDSSNVLNTRNPGRSGMNFLWLHRTDQFSLVDPTTTNINDMFIITRSYYSEYSRWLSGEITTQPTEPTPFELRNTYSDLLDNKMISDSVILHTGKFKILIGSKANAELRAKIKVVRSTNKVLTDNQLKIRIINIVRNFFDVKLWEFGETFFYTELNTKIQSELSSEISSTVLVPQFAAHSFGDLYQVFSKEDEIIQVDISVSDIEVIDSLSATAIRQS
jgi:hypothetical protein